MMPNHVDKNVQNVSFVFFFNDERIKEKLDIGG